MPSSKCSTIRHIVRLRQMLRRWRNKARISSANRTPSDVPTGHVAVCVGINCTRFVVPVTYLNHPVFKKLLVQAEEEFGKKSNRLVNMEIEDFQRYCHLGVRSNLDFWPETRPLLPGFADKTIW
ncbi:unnamed protein product [Lupinus luteus]|uniref:Uncharacterized protein n=1 Tax=Lupinus luteus TaxID=3873 RepID=A0AAV1XPV4_LUPLU